MNTNSFSTVAKLLAERLDISVDTLLPTTELESLGADSLTVAELIFDLEDKFGISVGDERPILITVQDIADNVDRHLKNKPAA